MSNKICKMHMLVPGKYYDLIFQELDEKITLIDKLGKLVSISWPYDPDVYMKFIKKNGEEYNIYPPLSSSYGYIEYIGEETEEEIKTRIQERTRVLRDEIIGNDWALRPENVVATQGIDLSIYTD